MAKHTDRGKMGEDEAVSYLISKGFKIISRNWRFAKAEIDIIAETDDYLVMVEVKTRSADTFGSPEEFVNKTKQRHLIRAANQYLDENPSDKNVRFDIIAILLHPQFNLEHIPDAFYP